jgi:hypothetical protein
MATKEETIRDLIARNGHRIFSVKFRRRTDKIDPVTKKVIAPAGSIRHMVCRVKVRSRLKGTGVSKEDQNKLNNLLTVFEMAGEDSGYKTIPIDSIEEIQIAPDPSPGQGGT